MCFKDDTISRQAAIRWVKTECNPYGKPTLEFESGKRVIEYLKQMPSTQPEHKGTRIFQEIIVEYPSIYVYPDYRGKPYFSIKYTENGQEFIGYGTFKPEVLSEYLKEYFMPSAQPSFPQRHEKDDCISRAEAITAIRDNESENYITINNLIDKDVAVALLENLPSAQPEQRWIPCSERLPKEEKKTYWVCTDTEYQCECRWTNNRFGIGEGEWGWSIFDTPQYSKPIAWMLLPEPYREDIE